HGDENQAWVEGAQGLPAEAKPCQDTGPVALVEDVGLQDEVPELIFARIDRQVERNGAFAAVQVELGEAEVLMERRRTPQRTAFRRLKGEDVGAQAGQEFRPVATERVAQVEDAAAGEGGGSFTASLRATGCRRRGGAARAPVGA